jgi:ribonuclease D
MTITLHHGDIPSDIFKGCDSIAIDTEAMGLNPHRDRLCVAQLSSGDGTAHLVKFSPGEYDAPNLAALLQDESVDKLFHFARFDIAILKEYLGVDTTPVYCTRTASKLVRTYTDRHSLKELCKQYLSVDMSKQQQCSDWGAAELTQDQMKYAASDVLYLHKLKENLDEALIREGRMELAQKCFDFLMTRADLDLEGWPGMDIFEH